MVANVVNVSTRTSAGAKGRGGVDEGEEVSEVSPLPALLLPLESR